jgi:hypothetical protein
VIIRASISAGAAPRSIAQSLLALSAVSRCCVRSTKKSRLELVELSAILGVISFAPPMLEQAQHQDIAIDVVVQCISQ